LKKSWIIGQRSYSGQPALVSSFFSIKQHGTAGGPDITFAVVVPELAALAGLVQECTACVVIGAVVSDERYVRGWHVDCRCEKLGDIYLGGVGRIKGPYTTTPSHFCR